jgi:hypothetical protein
MAAVKRQQLFSGGLQGVGLPSSASCAENSCLYRPLRVLQCDRSSNGPPVCTLYLQASGACERWHALRSVDHALPTCVIYTFPRVAHLRRPLPPPAMARVPRLPRHDGHLSVN